MRPALLALALVTLGCGVKLVDPCAGVAGTCLAIQVDPSATVDKVDGLSIELSGTGLDSTRSVGNGKLLALPVAVGVILDSLPTSPLALDVSVTGTRGGQFAGQGTRSTTIATNQHQTVHVTLDGSGDGGLPGDDFAVNPDSLSGGDLTITPAEVTLDLIVGNAAPTQIYTVTTAGGDDVSTMATWTADDTSLGTFSGNTFTTNSDHGGTTLVHASYNGLTGFATLHVKLHGSITTSCPGCPSFPPTGTPACSGAQMPVVLYPQSGVLLPPNLDGFATQFDQGTGNALFEIDFANAVTDVRVLTRCTAITDSKGGATNGCIYAPSAQVWSWLVQSNRGSAPVEMTVRATDSSGSCIATSTPAVTMSFAPDDVTGGLYFWQSVDVSGAARSLGGIFRYDFAAGGSASAFLAPLQAGGAAQKCLGCHAVSRDGVKLTFGNDDADGDDEYGDITTELLDVATKSAANLSPRRGGFQAFSLDHARLLDSDAIAANTPPAFFWLDGNTGAAASPATIPSGTGRGTQPQWSADGSKIVFVVPSNFMLGTLATANDNHFTGGSLFTMSYDAANAVFGTPTPLLSSQGENNYYPAWSPDGAFAVFDRVPLNGTPGTCANNLCLNDAFSNPNARLFMIAAAGGAPVDLTTLNGSGPLSNSWPRFGPMMQTYQGSKIAWVTFSSTRDYGDVVRNSAMQAGAPQRDCYPQETAEGAVAVIPTTDPTCKQPQLWMAAIDLTKATTGVDPSYPPFWLPFQDTKAHVHSPEWTTTIVNPPADAGACIAGAGACTVGTSNCCDGICCSGGTCGCVP